MINGKIIKVCGMREAPNIRDVESLQKVDMIGFIFYPKSPRYIYELPAYLPVRARCTPTVSDWNISSSTAKNHRNTVSHCAPPA